MSKELTVRYNISRKGREAHFVETGEILEKEQVVRFQLDEMHRDEREIFVSLMPNFAVEWRWSTKIGLEYPEYDEEPGFQKFLQDYMEVEEKKLWLESIEEVKRLEREVGQRAREEEIRVREEQYRQRQEAKIEEKVAWINRHGSDYLQDAYLSGYSCEGRYLFERISLDAPGFVRDIEGNAKWEECETPSQAALDRARNCEEYYAGLGNVRVVWLLQAPYDSNDYADVIEPGEALMVLGYLGDHDLFLVL